MSPEKSILEYRHFEQQRDVLSVVYADWECLLQDIETCPPDPAASSTTLQEHISCAFAYYVKCCYHSSLDKFRMYKGPNSPQKFITSLWYGLKCFYTNHVQKPKSMDILTFNEEKRLDSDRFRDHCHTVRSSCNLLFRVSKFFPILLHYFSGYDCHLFLKDLASIHQ